MKILSFVLEWLLGILLALWLLAQPDAMLLILGGAIFIRFAVALLSWWRPWSD